MLRNVKVQAALMRGREARNERVELTADNIVADLMEIKERCMQHHALTRWDKEEKCYMPVLDDEGREIYVFDARGATRAAELLGNHHSDMFNRSKVDTTHKGTMDVTVFNSAADLRKHNGGE